VTKKILIFVIAAAGLALLAALAYTSLEIVPRQIFRPPSREVLVNDFFALEKWLAKTGRPVRFIRRGDFSRILSAPEKTVFIQASVFDWEDAGEPLKKWIGEGGFLLVSVDTSPDEDEALAAFLSGFGVQAGIIDRSLADDAGEENNDADPPREDLPDFDGTMRFSLAAAPEIPADTSIVTVPEAGGAIRLIGIPLGAGAIAFIGLPHFMRNDYLEQEVNARLAWELTGAQTGPDSPGLLFIRGRRQVKSLFGKLADRGNFLPLGLSALILIIIGFWMVIPPFGLLFQEKTISGRPIGERFLAEIRFLKKYRALDTYIEVYIHDIKRKLRGREAVPELERIETALNTAGALSDTDIVHALQKLGTMMERL
jgi:hypothetical protein